MHIQEGTNTTLTTCTKMTEEVDRRHGVNGNSSSKGASEEVPVQNSALNSTGGRLKFFKDGKFILELVRGGGAGGGAGWVSVPRKTFWPPAAAPPTPPAAAPPCASLSASDDNSSVHSSPWQRDHCWKQPAPRRNLSKELTMYYCRPSTLRAAHIRALSRRKRRRPHDPAPAPADSPADGDAPSPDARCADDGDPAPPEDRRLDCDREMYYRMKLKKPYQYHKLRVYKKTRPTELRKELARTIDKLRERAASLPVLVNAKLASCRQEHAMVSPRKRILREMERVSLEDQAGKRRARTAPALSTASYPPSPGPSHAPPAPAPAPSPAHSAPRPHNGAPPRKDAPTKNVSSYSIHSLLSMPDDGPRRSPDAKRSPHSLSHALKTESPGSVHSPDPSPSPDGYRYRYSALALGSPGRGVSRDSPTPPAPPAQPQSFRAAYPAALAAHPAHPAHPAAPYRAWAAAQYRGSPARDEWRELPYVFPYPYAPPYRAPPPLWMHYAPPGPWAPLQHPLLTDHIPKDEPTSDLPLNLSKH